MPDARCYAMLDHFETGPRNDSGIHMANPAPKSLFSFEMGIKNDACGVVAFVLGSNTDGKGEELEWQQNQVIGQ